MAVKMRPMVVVMATLCRRTARIVAPCCSGETSSLSGRDEYRIRERRKDVSDAVTSENPIVTMLPCGIAVGLASQRSTSPVILSPKSVLLRVRKAIMRWHQTIQLH